MRMKNFVLKGTAEEIVYSAIGFLSTPKGFILDYGDGVELRIPEGVLKDGKETFRIPFKKAKDILNRVNRGSL